MNKVVVMGVAVGLVEFDPWLVGGDTYAFVRRAMVESFVYSV